ncbi:LysE family translocator [Tatumella citrea]|uniref:Lysine transporter LysE n=1 Tax=Tatumella citrea TaxID=53336 RepID=A0A1Y0LG30_TATCI|nr:LysE family translocator [Tatumella citrea]ARU92986.1 lysine transporter LysE [Tatumella citrea]ARU97024.1 lysine transporter LysE [Tatumella citrea]
MDLTLWCYFAAACFGLALTPGPNAMLVVTHSVKFGPSLTLYTIVGGVVTFMVLMVISVLGISALLKVVPSLLHYIKLAGGAYLLGLGIKQWMQRSVEITGKTGNSGKLMLFLQGVAAAASNPKVFLFFGAFLSQFINPQQALAGQLVVMVLTFALAESVTETIVSLTAGRFRHFLLSYGQQFSRFCGTVFIIIGGCFLLVAE